MRWRSFLPANVLGGMLWPGLYTLIAYLAGDTLLRVSQTITLFFAGTALAALIIIVLIVRRHTGAIAEHAENAYPGPLE